jgi:hypothetical protein
MSTQQLIVKQRNEKRNEPGVRAAAYHPYFAFKLRAFGSALLDKRWHHPHGRHA